MMIISTIIILHEDYMEAHHHSFVEWLLPFEHFSHGHVFVGTLSLLAWGTLIVVLALTLWRFHQRLSKPMLTTPWSLALTTLLFFIFTSVAWAMCPVGFTPPSRTYHPDNNTHGLLVFANGKEQLVLEPSFTGNATDFGLVLPLPSKPEITEAPEKLFVELEDLTNPLIGVGFKGFGSMSTTADAITGVRVIEEKDVGDFSTATLTADSADALTQWLDENGYEYSPENVEMFDYYVQQGGFYFVAMKVNMKKADVKPNGEIEGKLKPINFEFATSKPMLPLRSMAGDMEPMAFTLYTLAEDPYYVPGVEIRYSKRLTVDDLEAAPTLLDYNAHGQWLVRNHVQFDPATIGEDLYLARGTDELVVDAGATALRVNPHLLKAQSGIVEATDGTLTYIDDLPPNPESGGGFPILMVIRIVLVLVAIGIIWGLFKFKKRKGWKMPKMEMKWKRTPKSPMSQTPGTQMAVQETRDQRMTLFTKRTVITAILSLVSSTVFIIIGILVVREGPIQDMIFSVERKLSGVLEEAVAIVAGIVVILYISLAVLGPAMYVASKHGMRAFLSIIIDMVLIAILVLLIVSVIPWSLVVEIF